MGWLGKVGALGLLGACLGLPGVAYSANAEDGELSSLEWRWDQSRRYYLEAEVRLPTVMWLMARYNKQARAIAYQVKMVLNCDDSIKERRRVLEVHCTIDDIGLVAAAMPSEQGLLQPVLDELDERLTGTSLQLQIRNDGRIINIGMDGLDRRNRRVGAINENLRLLLGRALAGLDLQLPKPNRVVDGVWAQYQNLAMEAPSSVGTAGFSEVVHKVVDARSDGTLVVESAGRAQIVPGGGANTYAAEMVAFGTFDPAQGALLERSWTVVATPTAGSLVSQGFEGLPYIQRGRLKLLGVGEPVGVGETEEVSPPGITPTTLQVWPALGETPWHR